MGQQLVSRRVRQRLEQTHVNTMRRTRGTFSSVAEFVAVHETGLPRTPYVGSIRLPRPPWASIPTPVAPLVGSSVFRCTKPMRNNKIVTCFVRALTTSAGDEPVLSTAHSAIELGEVVTPCSSGEKQLLWHVASQADHQRRWPLIGTGQVARARCLQQPLLVSISCQ